VLLYLETCAGFSPHIVGIVIQRIVPVFCYCDGSYGITDFADNCYLRDKYWLVVI